VQDAFRGALFALDMSEKFDDFALCEARFYKRTTIVFAALAKLIATSSSWRSWVNAKIVSFMVLL